ncbi:MAG: type III-A CRISPR-associated protein Cas10/Csm1 [Hapalosiphonaceae cyanobacterium JJU2]|nr:MAG: type III-A CRISPR-associated protein Cas10/Csm1 [Hapalosiphonaceae cyanobacterium JJU2]
MTNSQNSSHQEALIVIQQAVSDLANWAGLQLTRPDDSDAIKEAKEYLQWPSDRTPKPLRLLFDAVKLSEGQKKQHFWQPRVIEPQDPTIPYPQLQEPTSTELEVLQQRIHREIGFLQESPQDWENLSLLTLILEKFGSFISYGESDVALIDKARTTAAVAGAIANNNGENQLSLVAGDLSGIQKFIYTISSDGALKSLRARSFYLELVIEEVVQQLLEDLQLPRTNVVYASGGKLYILAQGTDTTENAVNKVRQRFNKWLVKAFQGKVFLALDYLKFSTEKIGTTEFAEYWSTLTTKKLAVQKTRKFADQISECIKIHDSYEPCRVCHRDDKDNLKPLNTNELDSVRACGTCRRMFRLGGQLLRVDAIVRSTQRDSIPNSGEEKLILNLPNQVVYYHLFKDRESLSIDSIQDSESILLINNWDIKQYTHRNFIPLFLGNYAQESEEKGTTIRAEEMAKEAKGIKRVGYLRMDVDHLGRIIAEGLDNKTLPRIAGLSRQLNYFFKVYLNSLAKNRINNLPKSEALINTLTQAPRCNLLVIYAGGDDLFISGTWNEVVEFAFDIYQCFRAYTGRNPDITLSGGISIDDAKYPLYQAAKASGNAEDAAKDNGRDSLCLFGKALKWSEWIGAENINISDIEVLDTETKKYLETVNIKLDLFGVLPFVKKLEEQKIDINYARSFVRNLLDTAQLQEQMIKDIEEKRKEQQYENQLKDIRYYLHLPKIAYSLARLPQEILDKPDFSPIRKSLMSQYNAPYFASIATWLELLKRNEKHDTKTTN